MSIILTKGLMALTNHITMWKEAGILWTKSELKELELLYKTKAPDWAHKEARKESP